MSVSACRLELKWSQDNLLFSVCTNGVVKTRGGALERLQFCILAEEREIGFILHYQVNGAVWCKCFVKLVYILTLPIYPTPRLSVTTYTSVI